MSLDVYLLLRGVPGSPAPRTGVFVRENGQTRELTADEVRERWPHWVPPPASYRVPDDSVYEYSANITHNLRRVALEAGIYDALWRPDETGITHARQLVEPLRRGLTLLRAEPEKFKALNPPNGWGDYDGLVRFVANYLRACEQHPDAEVVVSR